MSPDLGIINPIYTILFSNPRIFIQRNILTKNTTQKHSQATIRMGEIHIKLPFIGCLKSVGMSEFFWLIIAIAFQIMGFLVHSRFI